VTPSIVLLGNLLVDDVVLADGTTRMGQPGGALLYGALGATAWDSRPGLVSILGDDYPAGMLEKLQKRGVDLGGVHPLGHSGVRTWLLYEGQVRRLIHRLRCPTHEEVSPRPALIPSQWSAAPAFHLAPMPFDVQRDLLRSLRTTLEPSSRSIRTCQSPRRRSRSGAKPSPMRMRSFLVRMNSCSTMRRLILIAHFLASSAGGSATLSSSAGKKGEFSTTRMTSAFTRGGLA
jgi:sugar/nucleoside kinase (ribokinase family)